MLRNLVKKQIKSHLKRENNKCYSQLEQNGEKLTSAYALKALSPDRVTGKQIEAARVALTRHMKRQGRVWTRIFPNIPVSKKPIEVRMGKGKGSPEFYACRVKPGRILFEVDGVSEQIAKEALYKASAKLPIKTKTIKRFA